MKRRLPLRREQTRAMVALVALLCIGTLAFVAYDTVSSEDHAEKLAAELIRDDATWLLQSVSHSLGVPVHVTGYRDGPAGLAIDMLRGQPHYIVVFREGAGGVDISWPQDAPGIVAVAPERLRERFTPPSPEDNPPEDDRPDVLHLPFPHAQQEVAAGASRKRAALIVLALSLTRRADALDESGFALRRYAELAGSMVAMLDATAATAQAPLPAELAAIRREASRLQQDMLAQAAYMSDLMQHVLDADASLADRQAAERQYNAARLEVNDRLLDTLLLLFDRFTPTGRRYQVPVDDVLAQHRGILDTLFDIEVAPNTGLRRWAQALLILLLVAVAGTLVALLAANRMRFPAVVRREMRGFGIRDNALRRALLEKWRERWLDARDLRDVVVGIRHDCREWLKQHRQPSLFGFELVVTDDGDTPAGTDLAAADHAGADEREDEREDKRQARARKRREGKDAAGREAATAAIESDFDLTLRVLRAADFVLYDLENVPAARRQELARFVPDARRSVSRRLWRRWCREFVGSDDATWLPLLERARRNDWTGVRGLLEQSPGTPTDPTPGPASVGGATGGTAAATDPRLARPFDGQSVAVIGGNPWMRGFYLQAVQQLGARKARWFDGTHDVSRLDRLGVDVVIFLFKGLSHGTSRRVTARQTPGRQARVLFSDHPGRSRFVASVLESLRH